MSTFQLRTDAVEIRGTITSGFINPFESDGFSGTWHLTLQIAANDPLLTTADGKVNPLDILPCLVRPVSPFRDQPKANQLLGELIGQAVRLGGSWGDLSEDGITTGTCIAPIAWIILDRGITPFIEEHGFSQIVRDVDVFVFSDDTPAAMGVASAHGGEDRHIEIDVPFPFRPQATAVPEFAECVDRDDAEQVIYGFRFTSQPGFPIHKDRQHVFTIVPMPAGDVLRMAIDTGNTAQGTGFYYAKLALTYDEAFDTMCNPDVCLADPGRSCQRTDETRLTYVAPRFASALAGDLLLGPAGGQGVLGRLLGALKGPQFYDHMVMFVEDDGQTVRHCTASDDRISAESYYTAEVKLKTPFGDVSKRLPIQGIRNDIIRFAWPGTISQTLSEVCTTGRNAGNPQFGFAQLYPEVIASEAGDPPKLWQLTPAERDKRTAFHDPEAVGTAKREKDADKRKYYGLPRLQKDPAFRPEIDPDTGREKGWIWPTLVKPHPFLAAAAQAPLQMVATEAKATFAHYRFFSYSDATIALNPAFDAPPAGAWGPNAGVDWAAGTKAAVCSSFVWASVRSANAKLAAGGLPPIELEGRGEPEDKRPAADLDGLYLYGLEERTDAAKALNGFTHDRVAGEVDKAVDDLPGLAGALISAIPGISDTIDDVREVLAAVVSNQLCNTFAFDRPEDLTSSWSAPGNGIAVSPDDTMLRWDVHADLTAPPPATPGRINVYGNPIPVVLPEPGWRMMPVYRIAAVDGKGTLRGTVVRRADRNAPEVTVIGATVRLGCRTTATAMTRDRTIGFEFLNTKAGRYDLQASLLVVDKNTMVAQEWTSKPRDVTLRDGDDLRDIVLELEPPPGIARTVDIVSHHDIVDRVVIGKDRWGHPDMNGKLHLASDPLDPADAPPEQRNTRLFDTWDQTTPEVGSGVHVRVIVSAKLQQEPGAAPDGSIIYDITIIFFDAGEGETNDTLEEHDIVLQVGQSHSTPYNMVSDDTVPERASGTVTITNLMAALP